MESYHSFPDIQQGIEAYLAENLPAAEKRNPEPMNQQCEVCVVIPAYGERNYILRPLESLARQEKIDPDRYEVIVVVNNPEPPAENSLQSSEAYREKMDAYHRLLKDNQETLELIRFINNKNETVETTGIQLTDRERDIIRTIRSQELRVFAIDKSSKGKTLPRKYANVGGARNRGVAEAVERFYKQQGKNGIIAQTDADTQLDPYYIKNILRAFKENPQLAGLSGISEDMPENPRDREMVMESLKVHMTGLYHQLLHRRFLPADTSPFIPFSGSCMATRAVETVIAGGIPQIPGAEDTQLGFNMAKTGLTIKTPEVVAYPAIRISQRTTTGRGTRLAASLESEKKGEIQVRSIEAAYYLGQLSKQLHDARQLRQTTPGDLAKIMTIDDEPLLDNHELEHLSQQIHELHTTWEDLLNPDLKELLAKTCRGLDSKFKPVPIQVAVPQLIGIFCLDNQVKKKFQDAKAGILQEKKQDIATLQSVLADIFPDFHQPGRCDGENLGRHPASLLESRCTPNRSQLLKPAYRQRRIAGLIALTHSREESLELIRLNYLKHLYQPQEGPLFPVLLELQALRRALEGYEQ